MKNKFIFIHIPKCAGNSIIKLEHEKFEVFSHDLRNEDFKYFKDSSERSLSKFSFTFVRNPWDRLVSAYEYLKNGGNSAGDLEDYEKIFSKYGNFKNTILNWKQDFFHQIHFKPQLEWICDDNGNVIVDYVGRFETLQHDFDIACDKMQITRIQLSVFNKTDHKHYTEYYDDDTIKIVAEKYAQDIDYFGYRFGE